MARKMKQKRVSIKQSKTEWEKKNQTEKSNMSNKVFAQCFGLQHYLNFHGVIADIRFFISISLHSVARVWEVPSSHITMDGLRATFRIACDAGEVH